MPPGVIPPWVEELLQTVTAFDIVLWGAVVFVALKWGRKWWRAIVAGAKMILAVAKTLESIHGLTDFMARTDKTLADQSGTLAAQDIKIESIHHETHHNNGSSLKDAQKRTEEAVERIELGVKGLYDRADASDQSDQELRDELERTRPPFSPPIQGATP